jgi:hypothetical protein
VTIDRSIDPTADQVRSLRDHGRDGPVVMVNLLKFRKVAQYPDDRPPCSGAEAYARYEKAFSVTVGAVSQAQIVYSGPVEQTFIAMMADAQYRDALVHRYAGLERTVLLQCEG